MESASCRKIDTEVTVFVPANLKDFVTSKFRSDKIDEFFMENTIYG